MKAVQFLDIEQVAAAEMAPPQIEDPRDAIVEVTMAGLCGSDLHPFRGREVGLLPGTVMGHEMVGRVVELGSGIADALLTAGDRVYAPFSTNCGNCDFCHAGLTSRCRTGQLFGWRQAGNDSTAATTGLHGCQSQLVRIPMADATLKRLPADVSDEAALLLGDNFSTGYYCAEMADIQPGQLTVVIGCGTVGQLGIVAARSLGAETIIAVDPVESRRDQAESRGAIAVSPERAAAEVRSRSGGDGADAVMELVGLPDAQRLAFELLRPGGVMSVIGCHCTPHFAFSPVDAYDKNLTYRTGRCPARHYMDRLTDPVSRGDFDLSGFVTHQFEFGDAVRAYDVFANQRDGCIKAVFVNR